jgi:hypothetical protein
MTAQTSPDARYVYHFDAFRSNRSSIARPKGLAVLPRSSRLTRLCSGADVREGCPASQMVIGALAGSTDGQRFYSCSELVGARIEVGSRAGGVVAAD